MRRKSKKYKWRFGICLVVFGIWDFAHGYSIFSGAGLGEPVERADVFKLELPEELSFESSLLCESINTDGKVTNFDLRLPHFRYTLPLPKKGVVDIGLDELLNLNFDIEGEWEEFNGDTVQHRVKGRGSASMAQIGIGKVWRGRGVQLNAPTLSIELGGFVVFGSCTEEWITDFGGMDDACDTVGVKFFGVGGVGGAGFKVRGLNLSLGYFSGSRLTEKRELPWRFKASLMYDVFSWIRVGGGITNWQWGEPFKPMTKLSFVGEMDIREVTLHSGFCSRNWYYDVYEYGGVEEKIGSLGLSIPLKSLLSIDLRFEFGKRWNSLIEEKIYRACISFQGREIL